MKPNSVPMAERIAELERTLEVGEVDYQLSQDVGEVSWSKSSRGAEIHLLGKGFT